MIGAGDRLRMLAALAFGLGGCRERVVDADPQPRPPPSARPLPTAAALAAPSSTSSALPGASPPGQEDGEPVWMSASGAYCVHARDTYGGGASACGSMPEARVWTGAIARPSGVLEQDFAAIAEERVTTPDACCYRPRVHVRRGRPLLLDGTMPVAAPARRADWCAADAPVGAALPESTRLALAAAWRADAAEEHAAVAAFARLSLELLALGAPPALLVAASRAAVDEIEHARACWGLAQAYDGQATGPAPLPAAAAPLRAPTFASVAVDALLGGCIGEGTAALAARACAERAAEPRVASLLRRIAEDELRHAELAWQVLGWALAEGGEDARAAVGAALFAWEPAPAADEAAAPSDHGRMGAREEVALARTVVSQLVAPLLAGVVY